VATALWAAPIQTLATSTLTQTVTTILVCSMMFVGTAEAAPTTDAPMKKHATMMLERDAMTILVSTWTNAATVAAKTP
jgi:hypothetical protein